MFWIGKWFGRKILEAGKIKFIRLDDLHRLEHWFAKWGFWLIAINRFLSGTRAVVSFFAGVSELDFKKTAILSFISSMLWYALLVYAGYSLGNHWNQVGDYLKSYSLVVTVLFIIAVLLMLARYIYKKRRASL
ncbi:MAG: DedA family protein [Ignavibacteriales bacterium]|nr:DedA family protein [Ignavibacteriales bacterium]